MTFSTIDAQIKAKLDTLTGVGQKVAEVTDYFTTNPGGFPCVQFMPANYKGIFHTNAENLRTYTFEIIAFQEVQGVKGISAAKDILEAVVDDIIAAFESDTTRLGGTVHYVEPAPGEWVQADWAVGEVLGWKMTLSCYVQVAV